MSTSTITKDGRPVSEYVDQVERAEIDDVRVESTRIRTRQPVVSRTIRNHSKEKSGDARSLYLGDPSATHVVICGQLWDKEAKAPFEPCGASAMGCVEYRRSDDKYKCHVCGEWHGGLMRHVNAKHRSEITSAKGYKARFGIALGRGFTTRKARAASRHNASVARRRIVRNGFDKTGLTARSANRLRKNVSLSPEYANLIGMCRAQTANDFIRFHESLGYAPTNRQMNAFINAHGFHSLNCHRVARIFGSVSNLFTLCGISQTSATRTPDGIAVRRESGKRVGAIAAANWRLMSDAEKETKLSRMVGASRIARTAQASA